ncbi:ATP-binding protein [Paenibacillus sp. 1P03SA]|uniref:ATP-binding protein n=1 Tax=Paenibacillus sp. 1P03SA TaxID=3132294 RepID=UPI0039A03320
MKDILVHLFIMTFPPHIYQIFMLTRFYKREKIRNRFLMGILMGFSGIFSISYPVMYLVPDFYWDLRGVPLLLAFMYGGYYGGFTALGMMLIFHGVMFPSFGVSDVILYAAGFVPILLRARFFYQYPSRKKIALSLLYAGIGTAALLLWLSYIVSHHGFVWKDLLPQVSLLTVVQLLLPVLLILWFQHMLRHDQMSIEIQKAEKLQHLSDLAASVAHEIRNPLQVTRGYIQISQKEADEKLGRYLNIAIGELDQAEKIISEFLLFAKPELTETGLINIGDSLQQAVTMLEPYASMSGAVIRLSCEDDIFIDGDPSKLKQAFINLIKNGIESTQTDGLIRIHGHIRKQKAVITITDNGSGMTKEEIERLGAPFYTTKSRGTGLGLMVTTRLIDAMRGKMRFASEVGKGSEVMIIFPLSAKKRVSISGE